MLFPKKARKAQRSRWPGFPLLRHDNYLITSPQTYEYNCIAWAAGCNDRWWEPDDQDVGYWPDGVDRKPTLDAFLAAYGTLGYVQCQDNDYEKGYEKIALYAKDGKPTHAARQLPNGRWTSKLGASHDIEHELGAIEQGDYGRVVAYMKRHLTPVAPTNRVAAPK